MKLHEALRQAVRQFGMNVLQERRLVFILSDLRAFALGRSSAVSGFPEALMNTGASRQAWRKPSPAAASAGSLPITRSGASPMHSALPHL